MSVLDRPDFRSPAVSAMLPRWQEAGLALAGNAGIQSNVERFLPKHPRERREDYQRRSEYSEWYNAYGRAVRDTSALPFSKPPSYGDNILEVVKDHIENIDGRGTHLDVFAHKLFVAGLGIGTVGILIDAPNVGASLSKADEEKMKIRPYWDMIAAEDIMSARWIQYGSEKVMTQIVLRETAEEYDGQYVSKQVERFIRYRCDPYSGIVTAQRFQMSEKLGKFAQISEEMLVSNVTRIPFVPITFGPETSSITAAPPFSDLLDLNVGHFRVNSDRRWLMHLCCVPVPVRKGMKDRQSPPKPGGESNQAGERQSRAFGSNVIIDVPVDGDFYWREPAGSAFQPSKDELEAIEKRMASIALSALYSSSNKTETAEAKRISAAVDSANLATLADALDDAIERALIIHAEMLKVTVVGAGGEKSGGEFSTSRDFTNTILAPEMIKTYSELEARGQLTLSTLWRILAKGGVLLDDFDPEKEAHELLMNATLALPSDG